jgi:hypothetical protein
VPPPAPSTVQHARRATPVQPPPPPPAAAPQPAAAEPPPGPRAGKDGGARSGRRKWLLAAAAAVVVVAVVLVLWRPWAGPDLQTKPLGIVPYEADLPAGWVAAPQKENSVGLTFGPPDLVDPALDDPDDLAEAAEVAAEDPERLVSVYADPADGLEGELPDDVASQILSAFPSGSGLQATGTVQVDGQEAVELQGALRLSGDQELRIYGASVGGEILLICAAPSAIFEDWQPICDEVIASVRHT